MVRDIVNWGSLVAIFSSNKVALLATKVVSRQSMVPGSIIAKRDPEAYLLGNIATSLL